VDWGIANPIHALAAAVARWVALPLPTDSPATLTVARWGGGTSINAIPQEAWVEFEIRSGSESVLEGLEEAVWSALGEVIDQANGGATSPADALRPRIDPIGVRPAGSTSPDEPLIQAALAATYALGVDADLASSSTDANLPMSLGVPAATIGAGGEAGLAHTPEEWYRNVQGTAGILRALLTVLLADESD
jgi:acetylornithine deacetylase/succinyl-diaminopimelate desuccinylase-like protein